MLRLGNNRIMWEVITREAEVIQGARVSGGKRVAAPIANLKIRPSAEPIEANNDTPTCICRPGPPGLNSLFCNSFGEEAMDRFPS
jgi:hypothetical protein